jgi:hypothetical protein
MVHDRIAAPTTTRPTTSENAEKRFTYGLIFDLVKVLKDYGYGDFDGHQTVDLMLHLLHFLHGYSDHCTGSTRDRQALDDVAKHRAKIDRKVRALRASKAATSAAMVRYDEQEARHVGL